jgi:hypothetical protein
MTQEKTFDRADLLRYFHETERDGLVGRLTVIHPPTVQQLALDQEVEQGEARRYPVVCETTALYCERYGFSVVVQRVSWPDGGDQYLPREHPLRVLTRERRAITRYGGSSSQLSRWAAELADAYRQEVTALMPDAPLDLLARRAASPRDDAVLSAVISFAPAAEPEAQPEPAADPAPADDDPDHNASSETLDDFLSGLGSAGEEE